uniref:Uncharacterized protein n=2 Tax=Glossina morsitans morsitans TaxID=37546 RepID=A0A1B0G359_GLOMM
MKLLITLTVLGISAPATVGILKLFDCAAKLLLGGDCNEKTTPMQIQNTVHIQGGTPDYSRQPPPGPQPPYQPPAAPPQYPPPPLYYPPPPPPLYYPLPPEWASYNNPPRDPQQDYSQNTQQNQYKK